MQVIGHKMRHTFLPLLMFLSTITELCRGAWMASGATSDAALRRDGGSFRNGGGKDTSSHSPYDALVCLCQVLVEPAYITILVRQNPSVYTVVA